VVLKELLAEHGRQFAVVRAEKQTIPATNRVRLLFRIDEGPKVKVGDIEFMGNTIFSRRKIVRSMRMSRPYSIPMGLFDVPVMSKTFDRAKLDQDMEIGIRGLYQNTGYYTADIKDPILTPVQLSRPGLPLPLPLIGRQRASHQYHHPHRRGRIVTHGTACRSQRRSRKRTSVKREYSGPFSR
jgi:outer membrane protein insertion porin family